MKKPSKGKLPKKPSLKKYTKGPKLPKGGIKTEAQLKAFEAKKNTWNKIKREIDGENHKRLTVWNSVCKKIEDSYKTEIKKYESFRTKVAKVKKPQ
jgi:hypothetical protein